MDTSFLLTGWQAPVGDALYDMITTAVLSPTATDCHMCDAKGGEDCHGISKGMVHTWRGSLEERRDLIVELIRRRDDMDM